MVQQTVAKEAERSLADQHVGATTRATPNLSECVKEEARKGLAIK
jgi:hypothetical protein